MNNSTRIAVVGGGWSGLAAATHLAHKGQSVSVFESARQLGGRARCIPFDGLRVDNGQHLMIGAYRHMLHMLTLLGISEEDVFERIPMDLSVLDQRQRQYRLRAYPLPAPLHLLMAIVRAKGFNLVDRASLMRFSARLIRNKILLPQDISVQALLLAEKQTARLIHVLWEPLCLATMNTSIQEASAEIFLQVIREAFAGSNEACDFLIPKTDLGTAIPEPAMDFIEKKGGKIHLSQRIHSIVVEPNQRLRLKSDKGEDLFDHVVLATPPTTTHRLLDEISGSHAPIENIPEFQEDPICTLYLQFPKDIRLPRPIMGFVDYISQWVFDRRVCGQPGLIAVVISGGGDHMKMDNKTLTTRVINELQMHFQNWPAPEKTLVVREKRATFFASVDINNHRPGLETAIPGLWLAGDFVANGLPATLEGAIRNGEKCAKLIHATCLGTQLNKAV